MKIDSSKWTGIPPQKFGLYSDAACDYLGSVIWQTPDGREVEVTVVTTEPERYGWPDPVNKGPVTKYLRREVSDPRPSPRFSFMR